eukprot:11044440-Ditylum_brightwellii.AAC.1
MDDAVGCACILPKEVVEECWAVSVMAVGVHLHCCLDGSSKGFPQGNVHVCCGLDLLLVAVGFDVLRSSSVICMKSVRRYLVSFAVGIV